MRIPLTDEACMARCLELARCGVMGAPPNPMVGALIVCDGRIIGEGYHARCGQAHAEVNAFRAARDWAGRRGLDPHELFARATLYVSLEPCAHYGKTPPCAELIVREGMRRVVVGCLDPFAKVQGRGIAMLREAGIEVTVGVLEAACRALNRKFFTFHTLRRPYITLKWAQSADGFMAPAAPPRHGNIFISNAATLRRVHHLRATHAAILVGTNTALADDPALTLRHWHGPQPLRIVLDRHGRLPQGLKLFQTDAPTLVWRQPLDELSAYLHTQGVQSLLIEGGARTLRYFIDAGLWDEAHVEIGPARWQSGLPAPQISAPYTTEPLATHQIRHYLKER